jgi:K+-sensing histidine kinase KdpD
MRAPLPADEQDRLDVLYDLDALATDPEPEFEDIAQLAARICGTPQAAVTVIDSHRTVVKAGTGTAIAGDSAPRDESFCAYAIMGRGLLVVPDARADRRFADNPYVVTEPGIRFYAGAPLVTVSGHALGTLCVTDSVPRRLQIGQLRALRALARQVTAQLELRRYATTGIRDTVRRQRLERLRHDLPALVSGRFREPLGELRRCAELLRDHDVCPADLAVRVGAAVHADAPGLVRLLDELLGIAGPAEAGPALQRQEVDLGTLAEWAVREVRPIADAKDIVLGLEGAGDTPVLADPRRLAQALAHLLFNAVKFTPCGGRVRVRVPAKNAPTVEVHDVGIGAEPARLYEHIYHGAIQPSPALPSGAPGLAAVQAILDAHHASVALCDGPDAGTALHVVFPTPVRVA